MGVANKRVLVVDDSRTMRQFLRMVLGRLPAVEITEATDGREALDKLGKGTYELVVTDINMPNMTGLELIRAIRGELKLTVPIVVITTKGAEGDRDAGLALGASSYVTKPISQPRLLAEVSRLLA